MTTKKPKDPAAAGYEIRQSGLGVFIEGFDPWVVSYSEENGLCINDYHDIGGLATYGGELNKKQILLGISEAIRKLAESL